MFNSFADAKNYVFNSGFIDNIDLDRMNEIAERLYRNAQDEESANEIIQEFLI